jgi:hypothetical protein
MPDIILVDKETFQQWIITKQKPEAIEKELRKKGFDIDTINANLKEYKRLHNAKRQFTGFICMGVGAFLGFISCVLAILNPVAELHNFFLYGLTSVAVIIVFIGLYFVFE